MIGFVGCRQVAVGDGVAYVARFHPTEGKAVHERTFQSVPQVVFRHTRRTWVVANGHLLISSVLKRHQGGEEPVHAIEERQALGIVGPHDFQGAARVGGGVARHVASKAVGDARLPPLESRVLAVGPDTRHQLVVVGVLQQEVEVFGVRLQVGVDVTHESASGAVDARLHGRAQSVVLVTADEEAMGVSATYLSNLVETAIGRTIVDK